MIVLMVIAIIGIAILQLSIQLNNTTRTQHVDEQAYHSAYSMTYSLAKWIESYDSEKEKSIYESERAPEIEKREFIKAVEESPVTIHPEDIEVDAGVDNSGTVTSTLGDLETVVTYTTPTSLSDAPSIKIVTTTKYKDQEYSVQAELSTTMSHSISKNTSFNNTYSLETFGMRLNVIDEIVSASDKNDWVEKAKNPAFMGRGSTASNTDFVRKDTGFGLNDAQVADLDLRVLLNPEADFFNYNLFEHRLTLGTSTYFNGKTTTPAWPVSTAYNDTATLLEMTGVSGAYKVPGYRFTYFTSSDFYNTETDTSYILARYLGSGNSFATNDVVRNNWAVYNYLYLYLLNESNEYFQISEAVSSDGGAIYSKRDTYIGGRFTEKYITDKIRFATAINTDTNTENTPSNTSGTGILAVKRDGATNLSQRGMLYYKEPEGNQAPGNVFGSEYYSGREIGVRFQCVDNKQPKTIIVFVDVYYNGEKTATSKETLEIPNVPDEKFPTTVQTQEPTLTATIMYTALEGD